ncbi:OpgC domain-containing protein [Paraburkholderia diazotrophica]|uniref:OpgC domain-containing protein n=1 Tax=Paraburkholderia diazotrophica TaxID=667676 RepID=UPI00317F6793
MQTRTTRSIEVDFFRGIVLIVIVLDHIPGGVLQHLMLHAYALCDSAEVFVCLGGYASAAAYGAVLAKKGQKSAQNRFYKRCWEIYRAYLLTALLTLLSGAILQFLHLNRPMVDLTDWSAFSSAPIREAVNIATFRRQPYLSSVLPMYALFAITVPFIVPLARKSAASALTLSLATWALAIPLAKFFAIDDVGNWSFNPFAWQLMFVIGILCRVQPVSDRFQLSKTGRWLTVIAIAAVLAFAIVKLFVLTQPLPGHLKQNLSIERVINFLVIAWVAAVLVRTGHIATLARKMPAVIKVGRTGLVCFVGGTLISLVVDTATPRNIHGLSHGLAALAGDLVAIIAVLLLARIWNEWMGPTQPRAAVPGADCR